MGWKPRRGAALHTWPSLPGTLRAPKCSLKSFLSLNPHPWEMEMRQGGGQEPKECALCPHLLPQQLLSPPSGWVTLDPSLPPMLGLLKHLGV